MALSPPTAKQVPYPRNVHSDESNDPYFWLRDREHADTAAYLEQENAYTESVMAPTKELQEKLYQEILGRIKEDDLSVPVKRDNFFYYSRTEQGRAYALYCRKRDSLDNPEEVLIDANALAEGEKYFRLGNFSVSPNHRLLAYSVDVEGDESYTIFVKDLETGDLLEDRISKTYYSLEWANDNRTFFYTMLDEAMRPFQVWRHRLGKSENELVYQENDGRFALGILRSRSDRFLYIHAASPLTSEMLYMRADSPDGQFTPVLPRQQGVEYDATHHGDHFYIRTNEGAKNFRLMRTPVDTPSKENWEEFLPGRTAVLLEGVDAFQDYLAIYERERGLEKICIHPVKSDSPYYVDFPEPVYSVSATGNAEYRTRTLRFTYTSLVTPTSVFDYNMDSRTRELKKQYEVKGGYDPSQYKSERIYAKAADGVEVPISLVYRADLKRDGSQPVLLYGYGSYGYSIDPTFSSDRLSLLDRGFTFAIGHIRGGEELGKTWHDDGKLMNKKNTFGDFIACAEHLIKAGYTSDRLAIMGGSAGGLLVGAVLNMRPELFRAGVAKVPYVDNLNTGLDPTLPLTISEYEEWGNPTDDQTAYEYIKSYSPYENVRAQAYPNMLVTAGLNDPRVSYWEPAKWVAKLRALKTDQNVLLLKTEMGSGHFGPSGRYSHIREIAFDYAFLLCYSASFSAFSPCSTMSPG